jgi:glycosyltransferase involved in cell wall biosynthesis
MISIVIPTLDEEANIGRILEILVKQLQKDDEVIIVDSHSKDRTVEIAQKYNAKIIQMPKKGNGIARTYGAKEAKNEIIVFLDADSIPSEDFLKRVKKHFKEKKVVAITGLGLYTAESKIRKIIYDTYARSIFYSAKTGHALTGRYWLASNVCAIRKDVFLEAGGYRSVICEDTDLARRMKPSRDIIYDSKLKVFLSDRRFKKEGFSKTLGLWAMSNVKLILGKGVDSSEYKKDY